MDVGGGWLVGGRPGAGFRHAGSAERPRHPTRPSLRGTDAAYRQRRPLRDLPSGSPLEPGGLNSCDRWAVCAGWGADGAATPSRPGRQARVFRRNAAGLDRLRRATASASGSWGMAADPRHGPGSAARKASMIARQPVQRQRDQRADDAENPARDLHRGEDLGQFVAAGVDLRGAGPANVAAVVFTVLMRLRLAVERHQMAGAGVEDDDAYRRRVDQRLHVGPGPLLLPIRPGVGDRSRGLRREEHQDKWVSG